MDLCDTIILSNGSKSEVIMHATGIAEIKVTVKALRDAAVVLPNIITFD